MAYFFRVIKTSLPDEDLVRAVHEAKLNNYLKYGWPEDVVSEARKAMPWNVEIESQSTAITMRNHNFVIVTTLCCENGEEKEEDKK